MDIIAAKGVQFALEVQMYGQILPWVAGSSLLCHALLQLSGFTSSNFVALATVTQILSAWGLGFCPWIESAFAWGCWLILVFWICSKEDEENW